MKPSLAHRLPAPLEAAIQALKLTARAAVERTIESLGLAALAARNVFERDGLLGAQFELNRKSAVFALAFNEALDERVQREVAPRTGTTTAPASTSWDALSLVDDHEVEAQISAERFGLEVAGACEWELRELDAYIGSLIGVAMSERDRNPLRPEIVGHALIRGIDVVSERADVRKVLGAELGRSLGGMLPATYAEIVADLRNAGVQPLSLAVRQRSTRSGASGHAATEFDTLGRPLDGPNLDTPSRSGLRPGPGGGAGGAPGSGFGGPTTGRPTTTGGLGGGPGDPRASRSGWHPSGGGTMLGSVDPALMTLMRRLAHAEELAGAWGSGAGDFEATLAGPLPNLIRAHRDELRQAAHGSLDHLVIDVIGTLFDQILADPKVPPQMARLIARLQVPVLRAALGDPTFFASRRHPVRRFVNRIASLGAAYDDFNTPAARDFLAKVRELVQQVVEGDFDQIETYESKLRALESFAADQARAEVAEQAGNAAELLAQKEDEARLRALYAQRLEGDLKTVEAPEFVREFISQVWSQVLLRAAEVSGADGELVVRLRRTGRELFLSVLPKPTPAHRKAFLAELPKLMQELTDGMNLIGWPEEARRAFFGRLMPAHAEALKAGAVRQLDINLAARQVEGALEKALPSRADLKLATGLLPVLTEEIAPSRFTPEEAERVGLLREEAIDWKAPVEIDLDRLQEEAELAKAAEVAQAAVRQAAGSAAAEPGREAPPLPIVTDLEAPKASRDLVAEVQIGFAYQMHLEGQWQKVRLSHVSAGRTFFVFTHGGKHKRTVSLTHRMLARLCETGRFRAYESAHLLERATARARRQLAAVGVPAG